MRRSWSVRLATALLAVCSGLTPLEGATVPVCPVPDMPMPGMPPGAAGGHASHAAGAPTKHPVPGHDAGALHGCTCPGACANAGASALPASPPAARDAGVCSFIRASHPSSDVAPRGAADHFLPFPSGPPSA